MSYSVFLLPLLCLFIARSELCNVLLLVLSVTSLFVREIYREPLNGFSPNSHGRRVWSLAWISLNVKVESQKVKFIGQISSPLKMHGNALAANNVMQQQTEPFRRCRGVMGVHRQRGRSVTYVVA